MPDPRHELGRRAEEAVAAWLVRRGWTVLARRWRRPGGAGELDIVARDPGGALVGVEVKLRRTGRAGAPAESVDGRRLRLLRRALASYAAGTGHHPTLRLDLVTVTPQGDAWRLRRVPAIDEW